MKNLVGSKFGMWTVQSYSGAGKWLCRCDCGVSGAVQTGTLTNGRSTSCGCKRREIAASKSLIHGHATRRNWSPTYQTWASMIDRCRRSKFSNYVGRGIVVCARWLKFKNFFEDMGVRPAGTTLERIDNNGNYEPTNCKWATKAEQNRNKRNNRNLTVNGRTMCVIDWAKETGLPSRTIYSRKRLGWSDDEAVSPTRRQL